MIDPVLKQLKVVLISRSEQNSIFMITFLKLLNSRREYGVVQDVHFLLLKETKKKCATSWSVLIADVMARLSASRKL